MELASILGTAAAVVVALRIAIYAPGIVEGRRRPVLSLGCEVGLHEVLLLVANAPERRTATGVELLVLDVEGSPGAAAQRPVTAPQVWALNRPILWNDKQTRAAIQPNLARRVVALRLGAPEVDGHLPQGNDLD